MRAQFSASTISAINKGLDEALTKFARRLTEPYPYLILDARYEKVREDGVIQSQAVLVAIGINWEGQRQMLGGGPRQPREPVELARVPAGAEAARPDRGRVRGVRRSRRATQGDRRDRAEVCLADALRGIDQFL